MRYRQFTRLILGLLILAGCAAPDDPGQVVEDYFQAVVADDTERLTKLTCAVYEAEAITLAASYRNLNAELHNMNCQQAGTDGAYNIVQCQGKIVVAYQAELREFPLSRYRLIQEDGNWRMCGEAA